MNLSEKNVQFSPDLNSINKWELYCEDLLCEYRQCIDEGKDIAAYKNLFREVAKLPLTAAKVKLADALFDIVSAAEQCADYAYTEPSDLDGIKALRQDGGAPEVSPCTPDEQRLRGAWVGRICGCLLGKPIEGIGYEQLTKLLSLTGNYPMHRYITDSELFEDICRQIAFHLKGRCYPDTIARAPVDDDTNYTVLNSLVTEKYGRAFTSANLGEMWLFLQSRYAYCTAERVAYVNLANGLQPPESALYKNPYREFIGAQIRGDWFGYICPGDPEAAAAMAFRDAAVSHIKNGIYGEMFVAAMLAAGACLSEPRGVVLRGLMEVPHTSRLYKAVSAVVEAFDKGLSAEQWFLDFHTRYDDRDGYNWCHTIPNAEIVVASLLGGGGDFEKSVCLAVQNAFDTDCNGATVGSVVGMMKGIDAIDEKWYRPLGGVLETSVFGAASVTIDTLVSKTVAQANKR